VLFDLLSGRFYLEDRLADADGAAQCGVDTYTDDPVLILFGQRPIVSGNTALDSRFKAQVERASRLRHPAIATLIDLGEDLGAAYFVYARPKGRGLAQVLAKQRRMRAADALSVLDDVGAALDFAHSHGVVHGALSASAIVVTPDFKARIVGFGAGAGDTGMRQQTIRGDLDAFVQLARSMFSASEAHLAALRSHDISATAATLVAALRAVVVQPQPVAPAFGAFRRLAIVAGLAGALATGIAIAQANGQAIDALSVAASAAQSLR
jgi:tRNA A-37 threonylcarbamoyl transferase component Bud32